jgi:GT2 family glycosyltransferase
MSSNCPAAPASQVSIIIPVHRGGQAFLHALAGLARLEPAPLEILVAVDGPDEDSAAAARRTGARVVQLPRRGGPARARNAGAWAARGELLLFLDADVVPEPDLVGRVAAAFRARPDLTALFGSYDDAPADPSFLSQYRNLLHHYTHQRGQGRVHSFWTACGAVRREAFFALGGFDESIAIPAMEDIELGYRLSRAGRHIELDGSLQVKHLKRWTAAGMLRTDIFQRAIPWTRLLLTEGRLRPELNLGADSRASAVLAWLLVACAGLAPVWPQALWGAAAGAAGLLTLNAGFYRFLIGRRGGWFALRALPWHWLYFLYASASFAYVLIADRVRPAVPTRAPKARRTHTEGEA